MASDEKTQLVQRFFVVQRAEFNDRTEEQAQYHEAVNGLGQPSASLLSVPKEQKSKGLRG